MAGHAVSSPVVLESAVANTRGVSLPGFEADTRSHQFTASTVLKVPSSFVRSIAPYDHTRAFNGKIPPNVSPAAHRALCDAFSSLPGLEWIKEYEAVVRVKTAKRTIDERGEHATVNYPEPQNNAPPRSYFESLDTYHIDDFAHNDWVGVQVIVQEASFVPQATTPIAVPKRAGEPGDDWKLDTDRETMAGGLNVGPGETTVTILDITHTRHAAQRSLTASRGTLRAYGITAPPWVVANAEGMGMAPLGTWQSRGSRRALVKFLEKHGVANANMRGSDKPLYRGTKGATDDQIKASITGTSNLFLNTFGGWDRDDIRHAWIKVTLAAGHEAAGDWPLGGTPIATIFNIDQGAVGHVAVAVPYKHSHALAHSKAWGFVTGHTYAALARSAWNYRGDPFVDMAAHGYKQDPDVAV